MGTTGTTVNEIFFLVQGIFRDWEDRAAAAKLKLDNASNVSADIIYGHIYHAALDTREVLLELNQRVVANGWETALITFSAEQVAVGYDVMAEGTALYQLLGTLMDEAIITLGGIDVDGYIQGPFARCVESPPYYRMVLPSEYANIVTVLDQIAASLTVD